MTISRETLDAYLDDLLSDAETAEVEQGLRVSEPLRVQLRALMQSRDRGEHSVGAVWRRRRLSCPSREQLGAFLAGATEADFHDYVEFHLRTVGCAPCLANLADLEAQRQDEPTRTKARRKRFFDSSAGILGGVRPSP